MRILKKKPVFLVIL